MSKRTPNLPQRPRGYWKTPPAAVAPLVRHLPRAGQYGEPCAGDGQLIRGLAQHWPNGRCIWQTDVFPDAEGIGQMDALAIPLDCPVPMWITNPPWPVTGGKGDPALSIIRHLCRIAPTWALLAHDFCANDYYGKYLAKYCQIIQPIGRVSWMGNDIAGFDNAGWYRFDAHNLQSTIFMPRAA